MDKEQLALLTQEMPFNWRVQSFSKFKPQAMCVPYVDARQVQEVLDAVCGPENWQDEYYEIKGNLYCRLAICIEGNWVWKSGCGAESDIEREKGEESDAFKRAGVKWGIGRFLYSMRPYTLTANKKKEQSDRPNHLWCLDHKGNKLQDWQITAYINGTRGSSGAIPHANPNSTGEEKTSELTALEAWAKNYNVDRILNALYELGHGLGTPAEYKQQGLADLPREKYSAFCHLVKISGFDSDMVEVCIEAIGYEHISEVIKKKETEKLLEECVATKKLSDASA